MCNHGLTAGECLICSTLETSPTEASPRSARRPPPPGRPRLGGAGVVLVVLAVVLVGWWLAALVSVVLRLAGLVAIAACSGWIGWHLGVRHGRRTSSG